jgi:hypothetical protein
MDLASQRETTRRTFVYRFSLSNIPSGAKAQIQLARFMYGLKPVPFNATGLAVLRS